MEVLRGIIAGDGKEDLTANQATARLSRFVSILPQVTW